jgi:hypothetical protein
MKAKFPYEDIWRERLEQSEPPVPAHIWDNIAKQSQKKRPFFIWPWNINTWIILLLCLSGISIGGYYLLSGSHQTSVVTRAHQTTFYQQATEIKSGNKQTSKMHVADAEGEKNNRLDKNIGSADHSDVAALHAFDQNITSDPSASTPTIKPSDINSIDPDNKSTSRKQTNKVDSDLIASVDEDNSPVITANQKPTRRLTTGSAKKMRIKKPSSTTADNAIDNESEAEASKYNPSEIGSTSLSHFSGISDIALLTFKHQPSSGKLINKTLPHFEIPCPNADLNPAWNKEYIDFYSSADYVIRQFNDTPNSSYMQMRKQSTSFSSAFSVGARYNKVFENGLSFRVGLNYSQINEKFQFVQGNIIQLQYIVNVNGDTIGSFESVFKRYKTSYNRYRTIDVPITMGYEKMFGKCTMNFNAGVVINAYSWNRGEVLDKNLMPVNINSTDSTNPYQLRNNIGVGGIASASLYYPINEKWKVFAEPYIRYNFSSMSSSELSLKQKYHTTGLKLGLRLDLK